MIRNNVIFKSILPALLAATALFSCSPSSEETTLPILGEREAIEKEVDGKTVTDTVYHQIPDFAFVNQDSQKVTNATLAGKIYVADFFFTSCPTICPKMKSQMLRIYEKYKDNPQVMLLSHTIDPKHDTVAVLKEYAERLNVETAKWQFVTGDKDSIYDVAMQYLVPAQEDQTIEGGFTHGGHFVLVDENRHIRGIYDGTKEEAVDKLLSEIPLLLKAQPHAKK
ncbi:SCO family protein [Pontibacter arcticus]|uniref:SCO family protein n=1 Tax=Pontibacter arcticus TaxID=2080288 RepID=A0A364REG2_9BACT|nr:SCO family protein [Pontibacter arcticus]RAU82683.1 SCO family protein [Pontibacter arcticus]